MGCLKAPGTPPMQGQPHSHPLPVPFLLPFPRGHSPPKAGVLGREAIALAAMFTCFLAPTAWVLAHVEHYKSRGD
uniref:Uncharacterized protein n=1 Tax=Anser cygnoides TaxID=8845 RepID=A0A8B9DTW4_ANSCY